MPEENRELLIGNWRVRGLGAPIVYLAAHLKIPYRMIFYEQGPAPDNARAGFRSVKDKLEMPFANLPYVIHSDIRIAQSLACSRYICRTWNPDLLGKGPRDTALVDTLSQILHDHRVNVQGGIGYRSPTKEPVILEGHRRLEEIAAHMEPKRYLAGDYVTYVDFILWENLAFLNWLSDGETFTKYPSLGRFYEELSDLDGFRDHLRSEHFIKYPFSTNRSNHGGR